MLGLMMDSIERFVHGPCIYQRRHISSIFSSNSEAFALELLENIVSSVVHVYVSSFHSHTCMLPAAGGIGFTDRISLTVAAL